MGTDTKSAFVRWDEVHQELLALEQQLAAAVALYAKGAGPFPEQLHDEVAARRRESDKLFKTAVEAWRTRR